MEDYLTEIFTYCLNQDGEMLQAFLREFNISDAVLERYSLSTQYELIALQHHDIDSRPDMAIISDEATIFIENKIDAEEGVLQLRRYAEQLDKISSKRKSLVYITRDYVPKDKQSILEKCTSEIKFIQLRWYNIFRFLVRYKENPLVFELLKFMKQNNLAMNHQFSPVDIITMMNFNKVNKVINETIFGEISDIFERVIGKKRTQDSTVLTQLDNHDRYVYYAAYANKVHIFLGYWMNSDNEKDYPEVGVEIEISPASETNKNVRNVFYEISKKYQSWEGLDLNDSKKWASVYRKKSLQFFLSKEDHVVSIKEFYREVLSELETILSEFPVLKV